MQTDKSVVSCKDMMHPACDKSAGLDHSDHNLEKPDERKGGELCLD